MDIHLLTLDAIRIHLFFMNYNFLNQFIEDVSVQLSDISVLLDKWQKSLHVFINFLALRNLR